MKKSSKISKEIHLPSPTGSQPAGKYKCTNGYELVLRFSPLVDPAAKKFAN